MSLYIMAAAGEMSVDAAIAAVLSDLDAIFTLKLEHRTALNAFFSTPDWLWQEFS